ncbi:MAG TPA: flagellar basal body rod protein FlgB [Ramlibacter sp.]|nr:flagellar basal body rod protein FlgB [Ramlibacter sp.]
MIDKLDAALRFNQEALDLRARRQDVLASNIANADTPNYKARDFDFGSELQRALATGTAAAGTTLATTSARHLHGNAALATDADLQYRLPTQSSIDGNTVEMNTERTAFAENAVHYETELTVTTSKIKSLLAAMQQ